MRLPACLTCLLSSLAAAPAAAGEPAAPGEVRGPTLPVRLIEGVAPIHPDGADGAVVAFKVLVHVDPQGQVDDLHFSDDVPGRFHAPTEAAIEASTFAPAMQDGHPIPGEILLEIVFEPDLSAADEVIEVIGERDRTPVRAISDVDVAVADVAAVPVQRAGDVLTLAPGVMLTRVGGQAEPVQIFLRGFDARHGQDIAFSVDDMPLNQVGNPHGHGLVNLDAFIPETLLHLRVSEGPFDPSQGDFAVAGSAALGLGLPEPGLVLKGGWGSFATGRAMVGWRHPEREGFFVAADAMTTRGYGVNRGAQRANAMVRLEGSGDVAWHLLGGASVGSADSAGLVRAVDVDAGRIDLFGSQDTRQGADNAEGYVAAGVSGHNDQLDWAVHLSAAVRHLGIRSNFTGFLLDDRRPGESPHPQRGDLLEQTFLGRTLALTGHARQGWRGERVSGAVDVGAYGRLDVADGDARRLRALDGAPYRVELAQVLTQGNVAGWAEGELVLADVVTLRASGRFEAFLYGLRDGCANKDGWFPGVEQDDVNCPDEDRNGDRLRDATRHARGLGFAPRGSVAVRIRGGHTIMGAAGRGVRSLEAIALSQDEDAPFGGLVAGELGWEHKIARDGWTSVTRVAGFTTHVARDLIFDEIQGANVLAGETNRWGATVESEIHVAGFTERTTLGATYARFGDELPPTYTYYNSDRQPGMLIPYVPPFIVRTDLSYAAQVRAVEARAGLRVSYIAPRPLPQSERSSNVFVVDLAASARWRGVELGMSVENLFDRRYPLAEYNFSSWFPETSGAAFPTRVPSRQISPGPPLAVSTTLTVWPGLF